MQLRDEFVFFIFFYWSIRQVINQTNDAVLLWIFSHVQTGSRPSYFFPTPVPTRRWAVQKCAANMSNMEAPCHLRTGSEEIWSILKVHTFLTTQNCTATKPRKKHSTTCVCHVIPIEPSHPSCRNTGGKNVTLPCLYWQHAETVWSTFTADVMKNVPQTGTQQTPEQSLKCL